MKSKKRISWLVATLCLTLGVSSVSAQTKDEAEKLYKEGKYGPALTAFDALAKKEPANMMHHYYIALCCQNLNQVARATAEYKYVVSNSRGGLKAAAQKGLDSVSRYGSARTAQAAASAANAEAAAAKAGKTAAATGKDEAGKEAAAANDTTKGGKTTGKTADAGKVKKIIAFTDYSRMSQLSEPALEATKFKYSGKITFQTANSEDAATAQLKEKYGVAADPPYLIYLDENGKVLKQAPAPHDSEAIVGEIETLNGAKKR